MQDLGLQLPAMDEDVEHTYYDPQTRTDRWCGPSRYMRLSWHWAVEWITGLWAAASSNPRVQGGSTQRATIIVACQADGTRVQTQVGVASRKESLFQRIAVKAQPSTSNLEQNPRLGVPSDHCTQSSPLEFSPSSESATTHG